MKNENQPLWHVIKMSLYLLTKVNKIELNSEGMYCERVFSRTKLQVFFYGRTRALMIQNRVYFNHHKMYCGCQKI